MNDATTEETSFHSHRSGLIFFSVVCVTTCTVCAICRIQIIVHEKPCHVVRTWDLLQLLAKEIDGLHTAFLRRCTTLTSQEGTVLTQPTKTVTGSLSSLYDLRLTHSVASTVVAVSLSHIGPSQLIQI